MPKLQRGAYALTKLTLLLIVAHVVENADFASSRYAFRRSYAFDAGCNESLRIADFLPYWGECYPIATSVPLQGIKWIGMDDTGVFQCTYKKDVTSETYCQEDLKEQCEVIPFGKCVQRPSSSASLPRYVKWFPLEISEGNREKLIERFTSVSAGISPLGDNLAACNLMEIGKLPSDLNKDETKADSVPRRNMMTITSKDGQTIDESQCDVVRTHPLILQAMWRTQAISNNSFKIQTERRQLGLNNPNCSSLKYEAILTVNSSCVNGYYYPYSCDDCFVRLDMIEENIPLKTDANGLVSVSTRPLVSWSLGFILASVINQFIPF